MTNSYSNLNASIDQNYAIYRNQYDSRPSSTGNKVVSSAIESATIGFVGGTGVAAGIDYFRHRRPVKGGHVSESFAQKVYKKFINKGYSVRGKEFFKQKEEVLNKLGNVKTPEEFNKLMKKNKKFCSSLCDGISLDSMCDMVNKNNLKDKISALKKRIKSSAEPEMQNIKDSIKLCWDKTQKKFVKPKEVSSKLFNIIKDTPKDIQWGKAMKYGGITAGILGILSLGLSAIAGKAKQQAMIMEQQEQ